MVRTFFVTFYFSFQELADISTAKSLFLRRESSVWGSLRQQGVVLAEANKRLAQQNAEAVDLRLLCEELKSEAVAAQTEATLAWTEASSAREQVASQAEEMQQWQLELGQVSSERDQLRGQAVEAASQAETFKGQLAEVTERLAEATARAGILSKGLAVAVGSAWSTQAITSQQSARAKGMFCPLRDLVLAEPFSSCLNFVWLSSGFETALNESVKNCKALAQVAEQKEADRAALSEAISAFCQTFGLDDVPSGSSPQSRLRALGDHMRSRLRGALHHSVRRAFVILASHYDVDLERVSEGYCLPDDEDAALAEAQRLNAVAEGPGATLASFFEVEILSPASPSEAGPHSATPASEAALSAAGGNNTEGAAPPPADA
jgi:hypothetical protein